MKFLVLTACVAVSTAQGFFGLVQHPNGAIVPVDEPAVAAAKADHLTTKYGAAVNYPFATGFGYSGYPYASAYGYSGYPYASGYPVTGYPQVAGYAATYPYAGPLNLNTQLVAHPNGAVVPVDEPAVIAARVDHLVARGAAYAAAGPVLKAYPATPLTATPSSTVPARYSAISNTASYGAAFPYTGPLNLNIQLVAHPNGAIVPVDEPAVVAARNAHLMTKGVVGGLYGTTAPAVHAGGYTQYASSAGLIAHPNGAVVPVDTPAVRAARVEHLQAFVADRNAHLTAKGVVGGLYATAAPAFLAGGYAQYASSAGLIAHPNGAVVPVDTPAVRAARVEHLQAKALAL